MNIPKDKVFRYPADKAILINDPRILRGSLQLARTWGMAAVDGSGGGTEAIDDVMAEYADKVADLRAKYEVQGDLLNGKSELEVGYYDELNALLDEYRVMLLETVMDFLIDDAAIDLMLDILSY